MKKVSFLTDTDITYVKGTFEIYYFRGDGESEATAYQIGKASQLAGLAGFVNATATYSEYGNRFYILTDNINLNNAAWTPIGTQYYVDFRGNFDGNGKKVSGLKIDNYSDYAGLFGQINGGTVRNLGVEGTVSGRNYVGGVAGWVQNGGSITNCYSAVTVSGTGRDVGGIAGSAHTTTFTNCYATGDVSGIRAVGGVVGY